MDVPVPVLIGIGACTSIGLMARALLIFLDHDRDRRLARHVFDKTHCTDGLKGYSELRRAQRTPALDNDDNSPASYSAVAELETPVGPVRTTRGIAARAIRAARGLK
jgi:hypothetical protein